MLELHASREQFEEAVNYAPGVYRLYAIDGDLREISGPVAHIEIEPPFIDSAPQEYLTRLDRAFDMMGRLIESHEHKDLMLADITKTLITSHTELQRGARDLLAEATQTIRVASGVEAVERPAPVIDVAELGNQVAETMRQGKPQQPTQPPIWMQLLNGPWGLAALQFVQTFAQSAYEAHAAQAQAEQTETDQENQ